MKKGKLSDKLYLICILPILLMTACVLLVGYNRFKSVYYDMTKRELTQTAAFSLEIINEKTPGDYELTGSDAYRLFKGKEDITLRNDIVDEIKLLTGYEVSIFYKDTRILTTIVNDNGSRIVGTGAHNEIVSAVVGSNETKVFDNSVIFYKKYITCYMPLNNSDGQTVGMLAVARAVDDIETTVVKTMLPVILIVFAFLALIVVLVFVYSRNLSKVFASLRSFLKKASEGDLVAELDSLVTSRNDEVGDIGTSALSMHRTMRDMMEHDLLTGLVNRRSVDRRLNVIVDRSDSLYAPYSIAIGDIDKFKSVNDKYGHLCGDEVLVSVSDVIKKEVKNLGFAARWGGEEFLIVFEKMSAQEAVKPLKNISEKLRSITFSGPAGEKFSVTMSFGVADSFNNMDDSDRIILNADERLYYAKEHGRNRIISELPE